MTTETVVESAGGGGGVNGVVHVHNKVGYGGNRGINKKRRQRKRNNKTRDDDDDKKVIATLLQELYLSCKDVFKGPGTVPSPHDVEKLCSLIDKMKPEDVGLSSEMRFFKGAPRAATIYSCATFSICIFFLPATGVIPLHNHPQMTVFSKLLFGTMHIKSYDLVNSPSAEEPVKPSNFRLAEVVTDSVFEAPCNTSVLYPTTGGNIHQFTAITPCAVIDVLGPPYSKEDGRDGSFYKNHPCTAFPNIEMKATKEDGTCYEWLEEIEVPDNSKMDPIPYLGPQIVEIREQRQ